MKIIIAAILTAIAVGIPTPANADPLNSKWVPCNYEDGSGQVRCVWVADERGNKEGHSFFINRKGVHFISADRARHMLGR